jgi:hypothetical protein
MRGKILPITSFYLKRKRTKGGGPKPKPPQEPRKENKLTETELMMTNNIAVIMH